MDTRLSDSGIAVSKLPVGLPEPVEFLHCPCGWLYKLEYIRQVKRFRCPSCGIVLDPHGLSVVGEETPPEAKGAARGKH